MFLYYIFFSLICKKRFNYIFLKKCSLFSFILGVRRPLQKEALPLPKQGEG